MPGFMVLYKVGFVFVRTEDPDDTCKVLTSCLITWEHYKCYVKHIPT